MNSASSDRTISSRSGRMVVFEFVFSTMLDSEPLVTDVGALRDRHGKTFLRTCETLQLVIMKIVVSDALLSRHTGFTSI